MEVEVGQRVAEDVGLGVFVADRPVPLLGRLVLADRVALEGLEQVREGRFLDPSKPLGLTRYFPSPSSSMKPSFWIRSTRSWHVLVVEIVEVAEDLVAVLHEVFGELVERLLGRLGLELLRPIPFRVFVEGMMRGRMK